MLSPVAQAASINFHIAENQNKTVVALYSLTPTKLQPKNPQQSLHQKGKTFSPNLMAISQGSSIDFINDDVVYHNVFSMSEANIFDLGLYPHGDHREVLFKKKGFVRVFCAIHPDMFAQVIVVDTPWVAVVNAQGKASIHHVPAGHYEVHLWDKQNNFIKKQNIKVTTQHMQVHL